MYVEDPRVLGQVGGWRPPGVCHQGLQRGDSAIADAEPQNQEEREHPPEAPAPVRGRSAGAGIRRGGGRPA